MIKIIIAGMLLSGYLYADKAFACDWAQKEVAILTQELKHNIEQGSKKSKQDTFNNLADVVQYELIPDCKGIVPNNTLMEVVSGLHAIKKRAIADGWWN